MKARFLLSVLLLTFSLSSSISAYDYPLSENSIREAYFLGIRHNLGSDLLAPYSQTIPQLKVGMYVSHVQIETPFTQIATHANRTLNYSAQDAVKAFYDKPAVFRIHLDICYKAGAEPNAIQIQVIQNKREITPDSFKSSPYYPEADKYTRVPSIGEQIQIEFPAEKISSSTLTIKIHTPDGQDAEAEFDLQARR
jgi:hypothetical protein